VGKGPRHHLIFDDPGNAFEKADFAAEGITVLLSFSFCAKLIELMQINTTAYRKRCFIIIIN